MALTPEASTVAGLATAALVGGVYMAATPPITDIRTTMPGSVPHTMVNRSRRQATIIAGTAVAGVSLITKDPNIFVMGGLMVIALDIWTRHANDVFPPLQKVLGREKAERVAAEAMPAPQPVIAPSPYGGMPAAAFA